jgi:hypothetical protein
MKTMASIATFALLGLGIAPSTVGCSADAGEEAADTTEAQSLSLCAGFEYSCVQAAESATVTIPAAVVGAAAFLSAPITVPAGVIIVGAGVVVGGIVLLVVASSHAGTIAYPNGIRPVPVPTPRGVLRGRTATATPGPGTIVYIEATSTAIATATAVPRAQTKTKTCDELNRSYHSPDACDGVMDCRGVSGSDRCFQLQERFNRALRCQQLRDRYNSEGCLDNALPKTIDEHLRQAKQALDSAARCLGSATAIGYECRDFDRTGTRQYPPTAVPAPTPPPSH